jgi:GPI mannosyltransferase 3
MGLFKDESREIRDLIKKCMLFSLVMHLVAAWFSTGYHMFDEHFAIFEFAGAKLGLTPFSSLTWEYPAQIRQTLQPAIVVGIMKLMGTGNPFISSFIVRLIAALLGWVCTGIIIATALKWMKNESSKKFLILTCTLLYCLPYLHARFSAEGISGSLFFIGLGLTWLAQNRSRNIWFLWGGLALGLSFVCRYQTGFMIFGFLLWCLFVEKFSFRKLLLIALPAFLAVIIGVMVDHWFYGDWISTAWNYFRINLIEGKAAEFGVYPWYSYFEWIAIDLIPPFSILIMLAVIYALYKFPKNVISLSFIPFLLIHIIIGHKEPRFLFPLISGIPVLMALTYDNLYMKLLSWNKGWKWLFNIFWAVNIILLILTSFKPASDQFGLYEYLYNHYNGRSAVLLSKDRQPYHIMDLKLYFHRTPDLRLIPYANNSQVDSAALASKTPVLMLFQHKRDAEAFEKSHPSSRIIYQNVPWWLYHFNINNWLSRTRVWILFEVKP